MRTIGDLNNFGKDIANEKEEKQAFQERFASA